MTNKAKIKEIFTSIQGEGPYIGAKQLFVRFAGCNLSCAYCDTEFAPETSNTYTVEDLSAIVAQNLDCHSVSLTGGEPLLHTDFLKEFLPECKLPVYLETNATLSAELAKVISFVDYISADIKLPSCTDCKALWNEHDKFFKIASEKTLFAKVVFDKNITDEEIEKSAELCKKYDIELILQPKCTGDNIKPDMEFVEKLLDKFLSRYKKVRLIPQVHKFLNVR